MALFQTPIKPNGTVHCDFRAGKMEWDGKKVTADKTKGRIVLYTSDEDQLMHFEWIDREKNEVVTKLVLVNDGYFERVDKCTTGRVYLLRMTTNSRKFFFWMQEPKADGDEELIKKFNETVGATIPDKKKPAGAASPEVDPALRDILNQFLQSGGAQAPAAQRDPPVPLSAVLTTDVLQTLEGDEAAVKEMRELLPEGQREAADMHRALTSPQLQQTLNSLTQAIHSDQVMSLFQLLGLDPTSLKPGCDPLEVLCSAMEAKEAKDAPK